MNLENLIELLNRSSSRLVQGMAPNVTRDIDWLLFMRREIWIHFKLTIKTWWRIIWWEKGDK